MTPSVFDSFNAKNLSPHQVAKSFIPPPRQFDELCGRSHSVVIGPRGSGKTTLLKMLQLPSLMEWRHEAASTYRRKIDFISVFIGADVVWREQMNNIAFGGLSETARERLSVATFTTHVLISLVNAIEDASRPALHESIELGRLAIALPAQSESLLVTTLANEWKLAPEIHSLLGIRLALRNRLAKISAWAEQLHFLEEAEVNRLFGETEWLFIPFYEASLTAIEAVNGLHGDANVQWALLFDELEIAPDPIRRRLLTLLRGTDTRVLLKLSISPYNSDFTALMAETGAKPGHDYLPIPLWYSEKEEALPFAIELAASILADAGVTGVSCETIFGTSAFDLGRVEQHELGSAYTPGSSNYRRFSDLAVKDPSFAEYLHGHDIDLRKMHLINDTRRAAQIRKLTSVVTVREAYFRQHSTKSPQRIRSRKRPQTFTGAAALFAVTEGNPRWIIGALGPLLRQFAETGRTIRREDQIKAILVSVERFRALLGTIELPNREVGTASRSLLSLIDGIGKRFAYNVITAPFRPEPATTFRVNDTLPEPILEALAIALNVGAIVFIPDNPGEAIVPDLRSKRFRLTYLLAPYYRLPPTIGKERKLLSIMRELDVSSLTSDLFSEDE